MLLWCTERFCECEDQLTALAIVFALDDTVRVLYWDSARSRQDAHPNSEHVSVAFRWWPDFVVIGSFGIGQSPAFGL